MGRYIEIRIMIKDEEQVHIEELAELIKDNIYDRNDGDEDNPIIDVTYELKEEADEARS